jgi:hypothetical protein
VTAAFQAAACVATGILITGCARNMLQTARIANLSLNIAAPPVLPVEAGESTETVVDYLQTLSREELLRLFCSSQPPSDAEQLCREWNGILLSNNNLGMTSIGSRFMSNVLFGKGRRWNGKSFGRGGKGINRFVGNMAGQLEKEHSFDYAQGESRIMRGTSSTILSYSQYQGPLSLWRTMTDEVRSLPGVNVLIGFGAMTWSGGMLNSAPFCLFPTESSSARL